MAKNDDVKALRAEVKRLQRNAGKKLARLRAKGIKNTHTIDPRKETALVNRYNTTQLKTQLERLGKFNSRSNQFVPGVRGVALPAAEWTRYKRVEKAFNKRIELMKNTIGGIKLGASTLTIAERFDLMVPNSGPSMGGGSMRYFPLNRSSKGLPKKESIPKLIADLEKKMEPGYQSDQEQRIRDNFDKLLKYSNRDDLRALATELTAEEFAIIWNFSNTVQTLVENYYTIMMMMSDKDSALEFSGIEESFDEIRDMLQWAVSTKKLRGKLSEFEERKAKLK